jgi:3-oxoacyl-[acyl-carrier-protein] synthase-3
MECLGRLAPAPADIGLLVTASNTQSTILPGLAPSLISRLRGLMPSTVAAVNMQGQGCAVFLKAIEVAEWYLSAHPEKQVLLVTSEAQSPYAVYPSPAAGSGILESFGEIQRGSGTPEEKAASARQTEQVVQILLFGDGAAAYLLAAGEQLTLGPVCHLTNEEADDESLLVIRAGGSEQPLVGGKPVFEMDARVPRRGAAYAERAARDALAHPHSPFHDIALADTCFIHTGSKKILDGVCARLGLDSGSPQVATSYEILRQYGNLSSCSIPFMLARHLGDGRQGRILMTSYGVGFSVSAVAAELRSEAGAAA